MAAQPTIYIITSDAHRNGKTLLARIASDYLLLDGKDPVIFDTDVPETPLRNFFPGRTIVADFEKMSGRVTLFDTILASPGRNYVIDLPQRHMWEFFKVVQELDFFFEAKQLGFRVIVFFIVDRLASSLRMARTIKAIPDIDHFVAVKNDNVGSTWPDEEGALHMPTMTRAVAMYIDEKRFSLRNFVLGDPQGLAGNEKTLLNAFVYRVMDSLNNLDVDISFNQLRDASRERH